jgi:hypothetical protein
MEPVPHARRYTLAIPRFLFALCLFLPLASAAFAAAGTASPVTTIYLIPSSHWDLGFLRPPEAEKDAIKPHLDAVIQACEADPQFRWTIESVWQLQAWLERTKDPAQIERLGALLRSGCIELSAAYGSMHTEFMGSEELNRLVSAGSKIERRFGIHPLVAMMNDVPGFSIRVPQVLARSGVKYLMTGSNTAFGGGTQLSPGQMPVFWESPDGSRILMWQTQGKNGGYTEAMTDYYLDPDAEDPYLHTKFYPKEWAGLSNLEIMQRGIDKLLQQYEEAGYRHSAIALLFMHDGIGPEYELKGLLPNVRAWNAAGKLPHIVVATPSEYFAHMTAHGANDFPVYKGDWSGLWSNVKLNSPAMSADARSLQDLLPQAETLWSLLTMRDSALSYPKQEFKADYANLFLYDEHNGAGQAGWPKVLTRQEVLEQNQEYSDAMRSGSASAAKLFNAGLAKLATVSEDSRGKRTLLVYNPLSWTSSHLVCVPKLKGSWMVRDAETGAAVHSQHLVSGDLYFEASEVPSVGYRTYFLEQVATWPGDSSVVDSAVLESPFFRVQLNPATGAIVSITDLRTHRTIVDGTKGGKAGALLRNSSAYAEPASANGAVIHHERGPLVDRVIIERPGSVWPQTVITLPRYQPVVNLTEVIDRSKMPFVESSKPSDLYSFAFAFSFQGKTQRWVDDGEGLYRIPQDLLPGASKDVVVPRHTLVWTEDAAKSPYHIMLAQKQAFFDRFQSQADPAVAGTPSRDGVLADVMIKSDQGDTKDRGIVSFETYEPDYPSTYAFSFALTGEQGTADLVAAHRFGVQDESAFVELPPNRRPARWTASLISVSAPNVILQALEPSSDGNPYDFLLRLQEIAGKPAELSLKLPLTIRSIAETTLTEESIVGPGIAANTVHISPYQTLTLRISVARHAGAASGEMN